MEHNAGALDHRSGEPLSRNTKLALLSALAIIAFFILREHWSHVLGLGPYLLLLLCPLMTAPDPPAMRLTFFGAAQDEVHSFSSNSRTAA